MKKEDNSDDFEFSDGQSFWNIVYPVDVYNPATDKSKETRSEGFRSGISLLILGCIALFAFLNSIIKTTFGVSSFWAFLIVAIVVGVIATYIFRFFIFKEEEKSQEFKNEDNENLGRYFDLLNATEGTIDIGYSNVPFYKFMNGQIAVCLKLRHGSTDALRRSVSRDVIHDIIDVLGKNNLSFKQLIMGENFEDSEEYKKYVAKLNDIQNKDFQKNMMLIAQHMFAISRSRSLVDCEYLVIYGKNSYQKYAMASALQEIVSILKTTSTVYRSYEFLDYLQYIEVCREYYGIDVIDLSSIKANSSNMSILNQYYKAVHTLQIETTDGAKIVYKDNIKKAIELPNVRDL